MTNRSSSNELEPVRDAIANSEQIRAPLDGLVERVKSDPGAAFEPEALYHLIALKVTDRAAFESLRAALKQAGCRVTELDEAMVEACGQTGRRPTQADIMIEIAGAAELFHAPDGTAYADLTIEGHRETWQVRRKGFQLWLDRQFFERTGGAPSSEARQMALAVIEAQARFDGPERPVCLRVGGLDGKLYLDLGDEAWRAVEIAASGWRVIHSPPIRFRRAPGMRPLPMPVRGGSVDFLGRLLNLRSDDDLVLIVAWMLAALRNQGPYPLLVLSGEQGSAKSTFTAILRALLDPNAAPLRALPREDRDLFIAAGNGHVLAFDNLSGLPASISDTLCRLATGGGFAVRQLYSDQEEVLFEAARPIILNGIEDIVTRSDLADRAIFVRLEAIPEERRRPEAEVRNEFEREGPRILGALLDALAKGLRCLPEIHFRKLPRMADFVHWASACETAFRPAGTFISAYSRNRDAADEDVIDADPVATALCNFMMERTEWTGTASGLLEELAKVAGPRTAGFRTWPGSPNVLSGRLKRVVTVLRKVGLALAFERNGHARTRIIRIKSMAAPVSRSDAGMQPSASSAWPASDKKSFQANVLSGRDMRTVKKEADGGLSPSSPAVRVGSPGPDGSATSGQADKGNGARSRPEREGLGRRRSCP